MAIPGSVTIQATSGSASKRCPLCACELPFVSIAGAGAASCANCGFDLDIVRLGQVEASRRNDETVAAKSAAAKVASLDPLDRWLAGESIQPKYLTDRERLTNWLRQHPRVVLAVAAVLLAAVIVPVASFAAYRQAAVALQHATVERAAAEQEQLSLLSALALKTDELKTREATLQTQLRERQQLEQDLAQLRANCDQSQQQCLAAEQQTQVAVRAARLAIAEEFTREAQQCQQGMPEISLVLAAKALAITQQDGAPPIPLAMQQVRDLLAPTDGIELRGHDGPVAQLAASRDGSWLASGDHQGLIRLWSTTSRAGLENARVLDGHWGRITQLSFTGDNRWLISGSTDSTVHLWKVGAADGNNAPLRLKNKQGRFASLAASDDGRWLAIAGAGHVTNDVFVRLWDLRAEDVLSSFIDLPTYQGQLCSLAVSRNGDWIATGNEDGAVRLWRISNLTRTVTATDLRMHKEPVRALRFAPDGKSLITAAGSGGGKGAVQSWSLDAADASADAVLASDAKGVEQFAMTSDGRWLFTTSDEPALRVRDLTAIDPSTAFENNGAGRVLDGQTSPVQALAVSANNRWLATAGTDNTVRLWYIGPHGPTATPITIRTPRGTITGIAFAGQGDWLATGNDRGNVQLWNLQVDDLIRLANLRMLK
jgi:WD40 repeat protein